MQLRQYEEANTMKQKIAIAVVILASLSAAAYGKSDLGVGLSLGEPTGLNVKYWLNDTEAIDGGAGWSFSGHDSLQIHGDYLFHRFDIIASEEGTDRVPLYYGIGARIKAEDSHDRTVFGIRVPLGVSYLFADAPFDLFAEIVPILDLTPDVDLGLNIAIGFRFYLD
jgi:hypothetical protein